MFKQIHILGASGSGTTTLGGAIAKRWGHLHLDSNDFFWEPTDPPYQQPRPRNKRVKLLDQALHNSERWVLSGSLCGWGDGFIPHFELVVFLYVPEDIRLNRLHERETLRFGSRIEPGGDMYQDHQDFMRWAASYEDSTTSITLSAFSHSKPYLQIEPPGSNCSPLPKPPDRSRPGLRQRWRFLPSAPRRGFCTNLPTCLPRKHLRLQ